MLLKPVIHKKVIDSPPHIPFTRAGAKTPPCILVRFGVKHSERVNIAMSESCINPGAFFRQKNRKSSHFFGARQVNRFVRGVHVAAHDHIFPDCYLVNIGQKRLIKIHFIA